MSFNQIYDKNINEPLDVPITRNIKVNNLRCRNLDVKTINATIPAALSPGPNGSLFKTVAGVPSWQYFQLGDFSNSLGPANSILTTNNLASQAAWASDLSIDSINIVDSDGIKLNGLSAGANQTIASDLLGNLSWQPLGSLPAGPNNTVYITDGVGTQQWSNNVITSDITATNALNSVNDTNLDNVNIISTLTINNIAHTANQVLGSDNFNILGWQNLPLTQKSSIYYGPTNQNYNLNPVTQVQYVVVPYNNLVGQIDQTSPTDFTCNTAGVYKIQADITCYPSVSELEVTIRVNGAVVRASTFLNIVSSFASASCIISLTVGQIIGVYCFRSNGDPTPKFGMANNSASPIIFTRIA